MRREKDAGSDGRDNAACGKGTQVHMKEPPDELILVRIGPPDQGENVSPPDPAKGHIVRFPGKESRTDMHEKIRLAILEDGSDVININFLHTQTHGAIHRRDIPLLIFGLQNLDRNDSGGMKEQNSEARIKDGPGDV